MSAEAQAQTPKSDRPAKSELRSALRKDRRWRRFEKGNRHAQTNADAWYAAMRCDWTYFQHCIDAYHGIHGRERAALRLRRNILAQVKLLDSNCHWRATKLLTEYAFEVDPKYRLHAISALKVILMYSDTSTLCNASQTSLASRAGLSQPTMSRWIQRFRDAGILELIDYDWRGRRQYGDNQTASNFTLVLWVPPQTQVNSNIANALESRAAANLDDVSARKRRSNEGACAIRSHRKPKSRPPPPIEWLCPKPGEWHFDSMAVAESAREQARELRGVGFYVRWPDDPTDQPRDDAP